MCLTILISETNLFRVFLFQKTANKKTTITTTEQQQQQRKQIDKGKQTTKTFSGPKPRLAPNRKSRVPWEQANV